jgi:O-antigen/teichoic acid export membrane protein
MTQSLSPGVEAESAARGPGAGEVAGALRRRALNSLAWSLAALGSIQVLRLSVNLVLTRLLQPEVFGLAALLDLFLLGLQLFSDVGLGLLIVRADRGDDPHYLSAVWSVQVVRGLCLWLGACALAWPLSICYRTPELVYFLPIVGLTTIFSGLTSVSVFTAERRLTQGRLALLQVGCYLVSTAIMLAWLLLVSRSVWALVVGRLASSLLEMAGSHLLLGGPCCRFTWDRAVVAEVLHFGKWVFVSTGCTFLAEQLDRLVVGQVASLATLGVYNLAVQIAMGARQLVNTVSSRVVFPYYSRAFREGEGLPAAYRATHPWAAGLAACATAGMISAGPAFIRCLFRPEYQAAGWMLQLVAVGAWFVMLQPLSGCLLWVVGDTRSQALAMGVKLLVAPACALVGHLLAGISGMIAGFALAELSRYAVTLWALRKLGLPILRYDVCLSAGIVLSWAAATQAGALLAGPGEPRTEFVVQALTVVLLWLGLALLAGLARRAGRATARREEGLGISNWGLGRRPDLIPDP